MNKNVREPVKIEETVEGSRDSSTKSVGQEMNEHRRMYEKEGKMIEEPYNESKLETKTSPQPIIQTEKGSVESATRQYESHEDNKEQHLTRIRKAMKVVEEEIKHIELMSEKVS